MSALVLFGIIMIFCCVLPMVLMNRNMNHSGGDCSYNDKKTDHVGNKEK